MVASEHVIYAQGKAALLCGLVVVEMMVELKSLFEVVKRERADNEDEKR